MKESDGESESEIEVAKATGELWRNAVRLGEARWQVPKPLAEHHCTSKALEASRIRARSNLEWERRRVGHEGK